MVENGYVTREEADKAKKEPLGVNPRSFRRTPSPPATSPRKCAARSPSATARRSSTRAACRCAPRSTRSCRPMARKALVDGLVRYDEARGWRGAPAKIDLVGRDWGLALAEVPALGDVQPWRLAVVLDVERRTGPHRPAAHARGLGPGRARARDRRRHGRRRASGRAASVGQALARRRRHLCRAAGGQAGPVPPAPDARDLGRHRRHGPLYRPRARDGRRLLVRPERVQPGHAGAAPAGLLVQAVRLRDGARQRLHAVQRRARRAHHDRHGSGPGSLDARRTTTASPPARTRCATASSTRRT